MRKRFYLQRKNEDRLLLKEILNKINSSNNINMWHWREEIQKRFYEMNDAFRLHSKKYPDAWHRNLYLGSEVTDRGAIGEIYEVGAGTR